MTETLKVIGVVSVPVPALVVSHPPELAVPTVKFTGPPVLLTVNPSVGSEVVTVWAAPTVRIAFTTTAAVAEFRKENVTGHE
jgi:hypothetical protein